MGFLQEKGCLVYREWAPGATAAQLIGDFNGWSGSWMEKDQWGTWSISLPDGVLPSLLVQQAWNKALHYLMLGRQGGLGQMQKDVVSSGMRYKP